MFRGSQGTQRRSRHRSGFRAGGNQTEQGTSTIESTVSRNGYERGRSQKWVRDNSTRPSEVHLWPGAAVSKVRDKEHLYGKTRQWGGGLEHRDRSTGLCLKKSKGKVSCSSRRSSKAKGQVLKYKARIASGGSGQITAKGLPIPIVRRESPGEGRGNWGKGLGQPNLSQKREGRKGGAPIPG